MSEQEIKDEFKNNMLRYLNGEITRYQYADITEPFYTEYISNIEHTEFYTIFSKYIPEACILYADNGYLVKEDIESVFDENSTRTGEKKILAPTVVFIKNGKLVISFYSSTEKDFIKTFHRICYYHSHQIRYHY